MVVRTAGWNHNAHYHPVVLEHMPPGCCAALDVGCGAGTLTRTLRDHVPRVVGIDRDDVGIDAARAHPEARDIRYVRGDVLTEPFAPEFDLVTAVAVLHHLPTEPVLRRVRDLLRPGGVFVAIGLARSSSRDLSIDIAATVAHRLRVLRVPYRDEPSPTVWPPAESYESMRRTAQRVLPGARFRRRLYWRYTLLWVKPG